MNITSVESYLSILQQLTESKRNSHPKNGGDSGSILLSKEIK
jgi:hypothetical protein